MENTLLEWRSLDVARAVIMALRQSEPHQRMADHIMVQTKAILDSPIHNIKSLAAFCIYSVFIRMHLPLQWASSHCA